MYTVFSGQAPKRDRFGLIVFVRTLKQARDACEVGERVVGWTNSGHPRAVWSRHADGKFRKVG
jgi:hypothetical protein